MPGRSTDQSYCIRPKEPPSGLRTLASIFLEGKP